MGVEAGGQQGGGVGDEARHRRRAVLRQPLGDRVVGDRDRREVPEPRGAQQPPHVELAGGAAQDPDRQPRPQQRRRQDRRAAPVAPGGAGGGLQPRDQLGEQPLDAIDDGRVGGKTVGTGGAAAGIGGDLRRRDRPGLHTTPAQLTPNQSEQMVPCPPFRIEPSRRGRGR